MVTYRLQVAKKHALGTPGNCVANATGSDFRMPDNITSKSLTVSKCTPLKNEMRKTEK